MRNGYKIVVEKRQARRPFVGPRSRWGDNIKINVEIKGCKKKDCISLNQESDQFVECGKYHII
jgi:hypothetical protein